MRESTGTYVAMGSGVAFVTGGLSIMYTAPQVPGATWVGAALALIGVVGFVVAWLLLRRQREVRPAERVVSVAQGVGPPTDGEVIFTDPESGRQWRYGEIRLMSEGERRRLETTRPDVFHAYRARLFWNILPPEIRQQRAEYRRRRERGEE